MKSHTRMIRATPELDRVLREISLEFGINKERASDFVAGKIKIILESEKGRKNEAKNFKLW